MLQNARVTSFTVSELLRENQQMGGIKFSHPHKLGLKSGVFKNFEKKNQCAQNYVFIFKYLAGVAVNTPSGWESEILLEGNYFIRVVKT